MQKTKPFNLEDALAGKPVVTRDRRKVTHLHHYPETGQVTAIMDGDVVTFQAKSGAYWNHETKSSNDLFMSANECTGYVVVFADASVSSVFSNVEDAKKWAVGSQSARIGTVTWVE